MEKWKIIIKKEKITIVIVGIGMIILAVLLLDYFHLLPQRTYTAEQFGITTVYSETDFNENGVDDYTDILLGAKKDAKNHPDYNGAYYEGGYPPDDIGVCTDVVWRAFKNAGYCLREMVHKDIQNRMIAYTAIKEPDKNIDFRRVVNLRVFFDEYAVSLTTDITKVEEWQPGDIVIFNDNKHIGIVSDKRNSKGHTLIIHNGGQQNREEDYLGKSPVAAHYRFDAARVPQELLISWE